MSKRLAVTVIGLAVAAGGVVAALAAPNSSTWNFTCNQVQAIIAQSGAVVMNTNPASRLGPETYERLVSDVGKCDPHEAIESTLVRASDLAECRVSYHCYPANRDDGGDGTRPR